MPTWGSFMPGEATVRVYIGVTTNCRVIDRRHRVVSDTDDSDMPHLCDSPTGAESLMSRLIVINHTSRFVYLSRIELVDATGKPFDIVPQHD